MRHSIILIALILAGGLFAQDKPSGEDPKLSPLRAQVKSILSLKQDLAEANKALKAAVSDAEKKDAQAEADKVEKNLAEAQSEFATVATGITPSDESDSKETKFDVGTELNELFGPMVQDLKKATAQPREIDHLREEVEHERKRLEEANTTVVGLKKLLAHLPPTKNSAEDAALRKELEKLLDDWNDTVIDADASFKTAAFKLQDAIHNRKSIWEIVSHTAKAFFLQRGLNILFAVVFFFAAFFGWRALHPLFTRFSPLHRNAAQRPFVARALDVIFHSLAIVIGIAAALTVLYVEGDWLLLSLSLIAVITVLLAAKNGLPKYYSQARLLLNLGEVREGERVVVNGLPWLVKSINMFTELVNPTLRNASLRLPISQIANMSSRPTGAGEPWFPCKEDDWVLLSDGTFGKAVCLTPEFVQLVQLGGAFKTYTTQRFIADDPTTFAAGFRVSAIVKVHPDHRDEALTAIPEALCSTIERGLPSIVESKHVRSVKVEFRAVIPDALEFDVVADFDGEVAAKYPTLQRAVQRFTLEALNAKNWKLGG